MKLIDNKKKSRFELDVEGQQAVLDYEESGGKVYLNRVYVPAGLRGGGVAAKLTSLVLDRLAEEGRAYVPVCAYVVAYLQRHHK